MKEIWKPIPSLKNYEASSSGRIRSIDRILEDSRGRKVKYAGKILSTPIKDTGYCVFNANGFTRKVHRAVAESFIGLIEKKWLLIIKME